jgi:hypothetical protein
MIQRNQKKKNSTMMNWTKSNKGSFSLIYKKKKISLLSKQNIYSCKRVKKNKKSISIFRTIKYLKSSSKLF